LRKPKRKAGSGAKNHRQTLSQVYKDQGETGSTFRPDRTRDSKTQSETAVPRTARARATAAPRTTRHVALTLRRDRRRLWQEKRTTLRLCHNDRVKKGTSRRSISYPFPFSLFLSLAAGTREGGYPKKDPSRKGTRLRASLLIRGSKAGPPEGFDSRLRSRGPYTHY
jgi:hypothetical protein